MELHAHATTEPGRTCPRDYLTDPIALARAPDLAAYTMYVVGGLYGNSFALDAIEALAAAEHAPTTIVLNGDAHWFDAEEEMFAALDARLAQYPAIAGNVEFELGRELDIGAGCGCAYPADVADGVVQRSNRILARLKAVAAARPTLRTRLRTLPLTMVAEVGGLRVGIVHGDATSVAGWGFALERLDDPGWMLWLDAIRQASAIDIFASTHTCGAVMRVDATVGTPRHRQQRRSRHGQLRWRLARAYHAHFHAPFAARNPLRTAASQRVR